MNSKKQRNIFMSFGTMKTSDERRSLFDRFSFSVFLFLFCCRAAVGGAVPLRRARPGTGGGASLRRRRPAHRPHLHRPHGLRARLLPRFVQQKSNPPEPFLKNLSRKPFLETLLGNPSWKPLKTLGNPWKPLENR